MTAFAAANGYDFNATEWPGAAGVEGEDLDFLGRVRSDTCLPVTMPGSWACCEARVDSCASMVGQCQRMICPLLIWAGGTKPMRTHVSKVSALISIGAAAVVRLTNTGRVESSLMTLAALAACRWLGGARPSQKASRHADAGSPLFGVGPQPGPHCASPLPFSEGLRTPFLLRTERIEMPAKIARRLATHGFPKRPNVIVAEANIATKAGTRTAPICCACHGLLGHTQIPEHYV